LIARLHSRILPGAVGGYIYIACDAASRFSLYRLCLQAAVGCFMGSRFVPYGFCVGDNSTGQRMFAGALQGGGQFQRQSRSRNWNRNQSLGLALPSISA